MSDGDPEILAMKAIGAALGGLDSYAAIRVIKWADARFGTESLQLDTSKFMHETLELMKLITDEQAKLEIPVHHLKAAFAFIYEKAFADWQAAQAATDVGTSEP